MLDDTRGSLNGPVEGLQQNFPIRLGGHADDPVNHVAALAGSAGSNLHPGEVLGPQMGNDVLDAVVTAGRAGGPHPELAHRQRHIVINDQHPLRRNLIKLCRLPHRLAGEVHIRLRLHDQAPGPGKPQNVVGGFELDLVELDSGFLSQQVHGEKSHVVTGIGVLLARIPQAHHQPLHSGGCIPKQHTVLLF